MDVSIIILLFGENVSESLHLCTIAASKSSLLKFYDIILKLAYGS